MVANRYDMMDFGISKEDIEYILLKARRYATKRTDKMCLCPDNSLRLITHFDLDQFIESQTETVNTIRKDRLRRNKKVLKMVTMLREFLTDD